MFCIIRNINAIWRDGLATLGLMLGVPTSVALGQAADVVALRAKLPAYMAPYIAMRDFSGRVLVAVGDSIVLDTGFVAPHATPSTSSTRYGIGSLTKTFTAAAVGVLVRQGKIRLTDTLARYVPEYPFAGKITIEALLTHTSGVPDYYVASDYRDARTQRMTAASFASWIGKQPLDFEPGTKSNYSNSGYALLAGVIERVSGQSYETFVNDELLRPAGLAFTGQLWNVHGALADGHNPGPPPALLAAPVPMDLSWLAGSGSMYATGSDLFRWTRALRADRLFPFSRQRYPYGWHVGMLAGDSLIDQTARVPIGYTSSLTVFTKRDVTIVILSAVQADVVERIRNDIAAMLFGRPYSLPPLRTLVVLPDTTSQRYAGRYEIAPGFVLTVRQTGHALELAGPDGDFLPLDALGESSFFFRPLYAAISFTRDSTGWNTLNWNGSFPARRVGR